MTRLNDYPIPTAFRPGKTVIMDPVTPFRLREGELELGRPFPQEEGRPALVNPYSMGAWDLPPAHMTVGTDPVSQWSAIPLGDEAHDVVYFEGWAFACLSVWTLDSKAIRRRAGDLYAIGLGADIGLAQLTIDCAKYAPRKVARHFVAIHLATGTVVGDEPAVDAALIELRNRNSPSAEWVNRVAMLWRAVAREDAAATLAAMVRAGDMMLVSPAPGALETFEPDGGAPAREKATLDMSEVGDLAVSSADGSERGFAKVSTMVTDLGWADATVDRAMSLSWEPADTKRMDPDHALLAQLKAALLAHCALEALVWATLRLRGGTDSTLTRWVQVEVVTPEGEEVRGAAPVQTTIMGALAAMSGESRQVTMVLGGDIVDLPEDEALRVLAQGIKQAHEEGTHFHAVIPPQRASGVVSMGTVELGGTLRIPSPEERQAVQVATVGEAFRQHIQSQLDNGATLTEVAGPLLEPEPTPEPTSAARKTKRRPKVDATPAPTEGATK